MSKANIEIFCCMSCGRDTTSKDRLCGSCRPKGARGGGCQRGCKSVSVIDDPMELEDDYSEDSMP